MNGNVNWLKMREPDTSIELDWHMRHGASETIKIAGEIAEVDLRESLLDASRWYVKWELR